MGTDGHRKRKLLLLVAASILVLGLVLPYLPVRVDKSRVYVCAVCGAYRSEHVRHSFAIRRETWQEPPSASSLTRLYDKLVSLPHEHEWVLAASGKSTETLFGPSAMSVADRFPFCRDLLSQALRTIETDYKDSPKEFRQELFQRLIRCKSFDEFYEILEEEKGRREDAASNAMNEEGSYHEDDGRDQ